MPFLYMAILLENWEKIGCGYLIRWGVAAWGGGVGVLGIKRQRPGASRGLGVDSPDGFAKMVPAAIEPRGRIS
jgi:hypothetical protein